MKRQVDRATGEKQIYRDLMLGEAFAVLQTTPGTCDMLRLEAHLSFDIG